MRLWSIHPKYLDQKGLVALWRESLLAKNVLLGNTKGYKNHPQLQRFKDLKDPYLGINTYLKGVYEESLERGYVFDDSKIGEVNNSTRIPVTDAQIKYEFDHLLRKLEIRDSTRYEKYKKEESIDTHPMFDVRKGDIEQWEKR